MSILKTDFLGFDFSPPIVVASGILGVTADGMGDVIRHGAGGITTKSITLSPRKGHKNPTVVGLGDGLGCINAVGLSGEGVKDALATYDEFKEKYHSPLIVSFFGSNFEEFGLVAEILDASPSVDILEVNISCPNVHDEMGTPIACSLKGTGEVTKIVRAKTKKPVVIKLSPNVPNIGDIAKAAESNGADGICAINTVGPGMIVDPYLRSPVLHNKVGGLSGPMIKPITLKCINDIYKAVSIPIIGTGGITTGEDAIEAIMCGASILGVGTAVYTRGIEVFGLITKEMQEFMKKEGIKSLDEIRGCI